MLTKVTDETKCESDPTVELVESSKSFENTIKPSDEFFQIFKSTYTFSRNYKKFSKKQIRAMEMKMEKLFHKVIKSGNTKLDDVIILAYTYHHVSYVYLQLDQKGKLSASKDSILHCFHLIKDKKLDSKTILLTMKAYSYLAFIYHRQQKIQNAIQTYDKIIELYLTYMEENDKSNSPVDYEDIINEPFLQQKNGYEKLYDLYIFILHSLKELHTDIGPANQQSFLLCHHLLLINEFQNLEETKQYKEWVDKVMELCGYLIMYDRFREARSHFTIAISVEKICLSKTHNYIKGQKLSLEASELQKQCLAMFMSINLCQAKYSITFLRRSVERLLRLEKDEDPETNNSTLGCSPKSKEQPPQRLLLFGETKRKYSNPNVPYLIPIKYIINYNDAYKLFTDILRLLYDLKLCFHPDKNIKVYMQYVLNTCNAYKYMTFYEQDTVSRFLLQNRRTTILRDAMNIVRENNRNELRQLRLQLAIAYSTLIDIKLEEIDPLLHLPYMSHKHDTIIVEIDDLLAKGLLNLRKYMHYA